MASKSPTKVLRIGLFQNNQIIEERLLRTPKPVTIGSDLKKNTFVVPASNLPKSLMVFEVKGGQYVLHLTKEMAGRIKMGDSIETLQDLIQKGKAKKSGNGYILPLAQNAQGRVAIGEATLLFQFVTPPPPRPKPVLPSSMRGGWIQAITMILGVAMLFSAFVHITPIAVLVNMEFPEPKGMDAAIPDRFVEIMTREEEEPEIEEPEPEVVDESAGEVEAPPEPTPTKVAKKDEPPKADEEPKDDKPKSADELARAEAERKKRLAAEVENKTILGVLGAVGAEGEGGFVDTLANGARANTMDEAFAGSNSIATGTAGEKSGLRSSGSKDATGKATGIGELSASKTAKGAKVTTGTAKRSAVKARVNIKGPEKVIGGTLDSGSISKVLKRSSAKLQKCYERELKKNPKAGGKIAVLFVIGTAGRVTNSKAVADGVGGGVGGCVANEISRLRFPRPKGGAATVKKSFVFAAGG